MSDKKNMMIAELSVEELAKEIYYLDVAGYEACGSELGRVFNGEENNCIEQLKTLLIEKPYGHIMKGDLALVGKMLRTVPDKETRKKLLARYNHVMKSVKILNSKLEADIVDPEALGLNESAAVKKWDGNDHLIICISRTEGSAGTDIGFALADKLHINYYDSEVFRDVIGRQDRVKDERYDSVKVDLKSHPLLQNKKVQQLSRNHGLSQNDAEFFNASVLLKELAQSEDFVIVGRCADVILQNNNIPHISVFITAPLEMRAKRLMELEGITLREAKKRIAKSDVKREHHYRYYTGRVWGASVNYDLCINSSCYGIEEAVHLILRILGKE